MKSYRVQHHLPRYNDRARGGRRDYDRLTDAQLQSIMSVAAPMPYQLRGDFLRALVGELGARDVGELPRAALEARRLSVQFATATRGAFLLGESVGHALALG